MYKSPKESYFLKNWKKMKPRERKALAKNISFFNISTDYTLSLSVEFLKEFENNMHWEKYSVFGNISEQILLNFKDKLIMDVVLQRNEYSEKFLVDNMVFLKDYIPIILITQKLSYDSVLKMRTFYELVS